MEKAMKTRDAQCHVISSPWVMSLAVHQKENVFLYHGINTLTRFPWAMLGSIDQSTLVSAHAPFASL